MKEIRVSYLLHFLANNNCIRCPVSRKSQISPPQIEVALHKIEVIIKIKIYSVICYVIERIAIS